MFVRYIAEVRWVCSVLVFAFQCACGNLQFTETNCEWLCSFASHLFSHIERMFTHAMSALAFAFLEHRVSHTVQVGKG
jgi:hypothetical protein